MKIYNPSRRSEFTWRELYDVTHKFLSVDGVRSALYHEFEQDIPVTGDFNLGYYEGKQQKKKWLVSLSDLDAMYCHYKGKTQISLWCDGKAVDNEEEQPNPSKRRRKDKEAGQKTDEKESELESIFLKLKNKHGTEYSGPQLRLWARMITAKTHDDFDNPPRVPMITGVDKCKRRESLSDVLADAAIAVTKVFSPKSVNENSGPLSTFSPSKKIDLRLKNLEQLRQLQRLQEEGILTQEEFQSQKKIVLGSLNNLV